MNETNRDDTGSGMTTGGVWILYDDYMLNSQVQREM